MAQDKYNQTDQAQPRIFFKGQKAKAQAAKPQKEGVETMTTPNKNRVISIGNPVISQDELEQEQAASAARELKIAGAGQKVLARIRQSSKYFGQTVEGQLFPVYITASGAGMYGVVGGPGGQYRLADVDIFVVFNEKPVQITFEK